LIWLIPWRSAVRKLGPAADQNDLRVPVGQLIGKWPLWSMSIAHVASNYVFYFLLGWLPLFLTKSRGLPITEKTLIATLGYAAQAVAALGFGHFSDRWSKAAGSEDRIRRWMMVGGQLLAAIAVFGLAYADSRTGLAILLVLAGIATGALSLNTYAVAQIFSGRRAAGTWVGIQNAVGNSSGIFGPIITGIIVQQAGFTAACWLTAAVAAFGAIWWIVGVPAIREVELD